MSLEECHVVYLLECLTVCTTKETPQKQLKLTKILSHNNNKHKKHIAS